MLSAHDGASTLDLRHGCATFRDEETVALWETRMGSPAEFTILVLLVGMGVGLWFMFDRVVQMQKDIEALKRKLDVMDPPSADLGS